MPATYRLAPTLGMPTPPHMQTEAAELARDAMLHRRDPDDSLVTQHERPLAPLDPVPAGARLLAEKAAAVGFEVAVVHGAWIVNEGKSNEARKASVKVAGIHRKRRVGFVGIWAPGAVLGLWYDGREPSRLPAVVGVTEVAKRVPGV